MQPNGEVAQNQQKVAVSPFEPPRTIREALNGEKGELEEAVVASKSGLSKDSSQIENDSEKASSKQCDQEEEDEESESSSGTA